MDGTSSVKSGDGKTMKTLKISGRLTVEEASAVREQLLAALEGSQELQVDLSEVTAVDLAGLQILCSSHQGAELAGKRFQLADGGNPIFRKAMAEAGFQRHIGCARDNTNSCIWVEERTDG
jgi:anti-anti-sigma regulatory factor